jgi:hypothetical protein
MTRYFATEDRPEGWKLEDILSEIQNDVVRRSEKIMEDKRPEARSVLHNNIEILGWLSKCIHRAEESSKILEKLGPSHAPDGGPPRIGTD